MTGNGWFQILLYLCLVLLLTKPLGTFLYRVYERKPTFLVLIPCCAPSTYLQNLRRR